VSVAVRTFDSERNGLSLSQIENAVQKVFHLRPAAILRDLDLRRPNAHQSKLGAMIRKACTGCGCDQCPCPDCSNKK